MGMPRRVYTYQEHGLWDAYNMVSTIGSYVMALGMLVFVVNVVKTARSGARAGNDPWVADTLEWYTTSPPPPGTSTGPVRDERAAAARSAPPAGGDAGVLMGVWAQLTALCAVGGTGLAVVSGAAGWDTAHRVLAASRLPPSRRSSRRVGLGPAAVPAAVSRWCCSGLRRS